MELSNLTYAELQSLAVAVNLEMDRREQEEPVGFKCPLCGAQSADMETTYRHIRKAHKYPAEDASTCIMRIYR